MNITVTNTAKASLPAYPFSAGKTLPLYGTFVTVTYADLAKRPSLFLTFIAPQILAAFLIFRGAKK